MGNCGVGFAPVRVGDRQRLVELMEGVEDIPGAALHEGLDWRWESFGDYLDVLEARPRDIDLCAQLPHGALRVYVMGERAARLEAATPEDIATMRRLAADAMRAGAIGFSTSRSLNHRSIKGDPTPSLRATRDELMGIAMGLSDAGAGVLQFISDFDTPSLEAEWSMLRELVAASGRPLSFSLAQSHRAPGGWRRLLGLTRDAMADGLPMRAQVAPRPVGVLMGLQGSRNPFSGCPSYQAIAQLPMADKLARCAIPSAAARSSRNRRSRSPSASRAPSPRSNGCSRSAIRRTTSRRGPGADRHRRARGPHAGRGRLRPADARRGPLVPVRALRQLRRLPPRRLRRDAGRRLHGAGPGRRRRARQHHLRRQLPTYLLQHWGRDRDHGRFDVGWLVKRHSADTAAAVGLSDRGVVAPGYKADLNVIDFDALAVQRPVMHDDLPAGGKRLLQGARGYAATIVSGVPVYRDGEATGALPGRLVRGARAAVA